MHTVCNTTAIKNPPRIRVRWAELWWCSFTCSVRTSRGMFLSRGQDKIIRAIEKRIADFTFIPVGTMISTFAPLSWHRYGIPAENLTLGRILNTELTDDSFSDTPTCREWGRAPDSSLRIRAEIRAPFRLLQRPLQHQEWRTTHGHHAYVSVRSIHLSQKKSHNSPASLKISRAIGFIGWYVVSSLGLLRQIWRWRRGRNSFPECKSQLQCRPLVERVIRLREGGIGRETKDGERSVILEHKTRRNSRPCELARLVRMLNDLVWDSYTCGLSNLGGI